MTTLLFGASPTDVATYGVVAAVLMSVAALASYAGAACSARRSARCAQGGLVPSGELRDERLVRITIRPATSADVPSARQTWRASRENALRVRSATVHSPAPQTADRYGAFLGTQLESPNVLVHVACAPAKC